ncbi:MAG: thermonuclease family protein [Acidobacteriota bacterium]|jgi:micrococcal nuclease|nr:thermonuclease family protein [Acidobacteriota bacterium]
MKKVLFFLMAAHLSCMALQAQSLADLARREQARRDSISDAPENRRAGDGAGTGLAAPGQGFTVGAVETHVNPGYKFMNRCKVTKVVDGDTLYTDCLATRVRMIGVDAPEVERPNEQCYGTEATAYTKQQLEGRYVYLERDPSQGDLDKYNRPLRYVYTEDGANFNMQLILEGYGVEYTYGTPYQYQGQFQQAQGNAEARRAGLWSPATCNGRTRASSTHARGELLFTTPITDAAAPKDAQGGQGKKSGAGAKPGAGCTPEYTYPGNGARCTQIVNTSDIYLCVRPNGTTYQWQNPACKF